MLLVPVTRPPAIVLATLNAKYIHASLGLRYLLANMVRHGGADLREQTVLREFTLARKTQEIVDELLATLAGASGVKVVGLGVYIWNVAQTCEVVRRLKALCPEVKVVLGGPEVSHEVQQQEIVKLADHVITGWGDVSFPRLCQALLHGPQPLMKIIVGEQPPLEQIELPYSLYSQEDLAHRLLYVEASRGCPFKCEFCLSSLDKTAWTFELDAFLAELDSLYQRGARTFKFVDRTFNLKIDASLTILQFFLDRLSKDLFLHFEVIPDHLPDRLKDKIAQFPPGVLQFEVGIQSFNVEVQQRISRRQDNDKTEANLRWLVSASNAHLHTDLIFGLPGESLASFADGFDRLYGIGPHEIQLGILKRLRGTPIDRHSAEYAMVYDPLPPYAVLQTRDVSCTDMQRFARLARYWDLVANSGRFKESLALVLSASSPFAAFLDFSDWLWLESRGCRGKTSGLTPEILVDALFDYLSQVSGIDPALVRHSLLVDYVQSGARARPACLRDVLGKPLSPVPRSVRSQAQRQDRHIPQAKISA